LLATVLALALAFSLWTGTAHGSYGAGDEAGDEPAPISTLEVFSPNGQIDMVDVPEDAFDEPSDRAAKSRSLPAADFEVEKLMDGGADADSIVVTIMGDGFTASEQDLFITKARQEVDYLTDKHPYKTFKNKFSVYAVKAISNQSGAAEQKGQYVDNYFGSKFFFDGSTERLLFSSRNDRVEAVLNRYTPKYDTALVLVNSTKYGGAANGFATISCAPQSNEIAVHENGHALGGLADEYLGIWKFEMPNMTRDSNPNTNKWKAWLGHENIGAYPYLGDPEEDPNWFRPPQSGEMRYL
jgi:hypothetical protein